MGVTNSIIGTAVAIITGLIIASIPTFHISLDSILSMLFIGIVWSALIWGFRSGLWMAVISMIGIASGLALELIVPKVENWEFRIIF